MDDNSPLQDEFIIEDIEALKMIADPLRLQIIRNLEQPRTVKDLAERLDIPATKLYYHVNQLEKHQIIQVVQTRVVSGIIEKHYRVTAKTYHVSKTLLRGTKDSDEQLETILTAIFDTAKAELRASIKAGLLTVDEAVEREKDGIVWHGSMSLSPERFAELNGRLQALLEEFDEVVKEEGKNTAVKKPYGLVVTFYPIVNERE
ncbi:MAG: helix-turn-helix domain-containing protein [Ardenticatenaceae bacterium]|nr:helix-turn-helix domain-containing protein [Ardenticatenaceae bacterium]MCB9444800.1 helix-turn-helix domain-containing protein [Ardenticatenaceae bacterium]